jgi:hypothetical protein
LIHRGITGFVKSRPLEATTTLPYLVSSTGNLGEPFLSNA